MLLHVVRPSISTSSISSLTSPSCGSDKLGEFGSAFGSAGKQQELGASNGRIREYGPAVRTEI